MNRGRPAATRRVGRPPQLQSMVVKVLQVHPELQGRPSDIAIHVRAAAPRFAEAKGSDVSIAYSKLRRRFEDFFDPNDLHADPYHVKKLALADDGGEGLPGVRGHR